MTLPPTLTDLTRAQAALARSQAKTETARAYRNALMADLKASGVGVSALARATGLTRSGVYDQLGAEHT